MQHDKNLPREEQHQGITIIREPILFPFSRGCFSLSIWLRFLKEARKADIVFLNSPSLNILLFAFVAKLFNKRLAIFHQADIILPTGLRNRFIELIFRWHTKWAMSLADSVGCYSLDYAQQSCVLHPFLSKFIPFRMPVTRHSPVSLEPLERLNQLERTGKPIFGFAGRFVHEKGFDILFRAIPLIKKELPNCHFVFAGETRIPYESFYESLSEKLKQMESSISFLGLLNDHQLTSFYSSLDLFIMPSRSDCFGMVQAEAALLGKPIVVANIPGCRDLVCQTSFGELFETENPESLAKATIHAFRHRESYQSKHPCVLDYLGSDARKKPLRSFLCGESSDPSSSNPS